LHCQFFVSGRLAGRLDGVLWTIGREFVGRLDVVSWTIGRRFIGLLDEVLWAIGRDLLMDWVVEKA